MAAHNLPNLGLTGGFVLGEDDWGDEMNVNLLKLSTLVQGGVLGRIDAVPTDPAPAEGDVYILTTDNTIAVFDEAAWTYFAPREGWLIYDRGTDEYLTFDGAAWAVLETGGGGIEDAPADGSPYSRQDNAWVPAAAGGALSPYRFGGFFTRTPEADEVLMSHIATDSFTLPANLEGSLVSVGTNPSADTVLTLRAGNEAIGTITVAASGSVAIVSAEEDVVPGTVLSVVAPAAANGLANVAFTLRGSGTGSDFRYVSLTQAEYDALATKNETTFYFIAE